MSSSMGDFSFKEIVQSVFGRIDKANKSKEASKTNLEGIRKNEAMAEPAKVTKEAAVTKESSKGQISRASALLKALNPMKASQSNNMNHLVNFLYNKNASVDEPFKFAAGGKKYCAWATSKNLDGVVTSTITVQPTRHQESRRKLTIVQGQQERLIVTLDAKGKLQGMTLGGHSIDKKDPRVVSRLAGLQMEAFSEVKVAERYDSKSINVTKTIREWIGRSAESISNAFRKAKNSNTLSNAVEIARTPYKMAARKVRSLNEPKASDISNVATNRMRSTAFSTPISSVTPQESPAPEITPEITPQVAPKAESLFTKENPAKFTQDGDAYIAWESVDETSGTSMVTVQQANGSAKQLTLHFSNDGSVTDVKYDGRSHLPGATQDELEEFAEGVMDTIFEGMEVAPKKQVNEPPLNPQQQANKEYLERTKGLFDDLPGDIHE